IAEATVKISNADKISAWLTKYRVNISNLVSAEKERHEPNSNISSCCTVCILSKATKARPVQR
ncbi:hypothetical protein, partial [Megamonas hypermegale]|uniref:hypothetical protein n=1 Tax=Megamonas hypermegale TaxID=158847 RepID=UPI0026F2C6C0